MIIHGWKTAATILTTIVLTTALSGCHTVQSGAPHPFTTMFEYERETHEPQFSIYRRQLPETEATPEFATAAAEPQTVH